MKILIKRKIKFKRYYIFTRKKNYKINNILGVYNFALKEKYIEMNESKRNKTFKIFKHI